MKARWMVVFCAVVVLAGVSLRGRMRFYGERGESGIERGARQGRGAVASSNSSRPESTVADIKAARDEVAPLWQEVLAAAKDVKDADVAAAEKAWADHGWGYQRARVPTTPASCRRPGSCSHLFRLF